MGLTKLLTLGYLLWPSWGISASGFREPSQGNGAWNRNARKVLEMPVVAPWHGSRKTKQLYRKGKRAVESSKVWGLLLLVWSWQPWGSSEKRADVTGLWEFRIAEPVVGWEMLLWITSEVLPTPLSWMANDLKNAESYLWVVLHFESSTPKAPILTCPSHRRLLGSAMLSLLFMCLPRRIQNRGCLCQVSDWYPLGQPKGRKITGFLSLFCQKNIFISTELSVEK